MTLPTLDLTDMIFTDYVKCAKDLSQKLRDQVAFFFMILYIVRGNMNNYN